MDRRSFLSTASATAFALPFSLRAAGAKAQTAAPGDAALNALFDAHQQNGSAQMMYRTRMHYARLR